MDEIPRELYDLVDTFARNHADWDIVAEPFLKRDLTKRKTLTGWPTDAEMRKMLGQLKRRYLEQLQGGARRVSEE